jgi:hypothetical protein
VDEGRLTEVAVGNGIVSFDGRVLELFGHASRTGNRIHVGLITATEGMVDYSIVLAGEDEKRDEVEALIAAVRAAAPGL